MTRFLHPGQPPALFLALVVLGGCAWIQGEGRNIPRMHRNLSKAIDIQSGVVQGNLGKAREAAAWLLGREGMMAFPPEAEVYEEEMLDHATRIAEATDLTLAGRQTGLLAAACGSCHQALNGGPRFVVGSDAPGGNTQEAQMVRHLWAVDRMWEGLVGPSDEAWSAGATALSETGPALAPMFRISTPVPDIETLLGEINRLALQATEATSPQERGELYGTLLGTCNRCHGIRSTLGARF